MSQRYIGGLIYNPPGGFSGYFDGSGDFLTWTGTAAGAGAFCYEFWIFSQNGFATMRAPLGVIAISGYNSALDIRMTGSTINVSQYNVANNNFTVDPLQANTWYHIAVCRNASNQTTVFVNGVRSSTGAVTIATNFSGLTSAIGRLDPSNGGDVTGYITNVRLITGSTPYDPTQTTITVPSGPLQAISGTQFLSCAYPTFRDGSSNNFTITVNGNTAVSTQNPFPQTQLPNPALGNQGNGVYSMSQYQALRSQNLWPAIDPYFDYVTLMLHGNGTNGAQNNTFLDSSTNNFTITRNGNTTQGTFTPYGSNWSNYFGATGQYLSVAYSSAFNLTGDFTVECWINPGNLPSSIGPAAQSYERVFSFGTYNAANSLGLEINSNDSGNLRRFVSWYNGTSYGLGSNNAVAPGNWYHIAMVRSGTTITLYLNGTSIGTITGASAAVNTSQAFYIASLQGFEGDASAAFNGYISNFRIVKSAVYTSNFTPSASPLTAITNTVLLTCQDNRFRDNSTNNATVSVAGSPSVQRFSPFAPTTPYAAGTIGGSGYYDGSGDSLSAGDQTAFEFGAGAFTIEAWVYPTSYSSVFTIAQKYVGGDVANSEFLFYATTAGRLAIALDGGGGEDFFQSATGLVPLNTWTHCAVTKSGSTVLLFVNGVQVQSGTSSRTLNSTSTALFAGVSGTAGYMTDLRLLKGTALYTGAFTPPSAPLTNITNTSLLLNFTNGGIIDNAMMNDLETVGNAQISTSVSKFGGGSLAFDGTGARLISPSSPNAAMGSGDFTWEAWVYFASGSTFRQIMSTRASSGTASTTAASLAVNTSNGLTWFTNTTIVGYATSIGVNQWVHVAVSRAGTTLRVFANGIQVGSATNSDNLTAGILSVGANNDGSEPFNGNIDDLRITKGYARYTANFTPQRSQWQDQ